MLKRYDISYFTPKSLIIYILKAITHGHYFHGILLNLDWIEDGDIKNNDDAIETNSEEQVNVEVYHDEKEISEYDE